MITGREVVDYAVTIGTGRPYVLGTVGPNAYDCSGLILAVFKHFGIATFPNLPHEAGAQARWLATHGQQISIGAASNTPGAVLAIDRGWSGVGAGGNHIGFCRAPGISFEARSRVYGIGSWPLSDHKWTGAYLIPGVDYTLQEEPELEPPEGEPVPYLLIKSKAFRNVYALFPGGTIRPLSGLRELAKLVAVGIVLDDGADLEEITKLHKLSGDTGQLDPI